MYSISKYYFLFIYWQALKYKQKLEDINAWLDEIEGEFQFESYAADVYSIQQEIDKLRVRI